jgi:hypothetical protein
MQLIGDWLILIAAVMALALMIAAILSKWF